MASKKSSTSGALFASAVGGYRKQDVNDYIVRMDTERAEEIAALEEKIAAAEETLALTKEELEAKLEEISVLQAKIEEMKSESEELKAVHAAELAEAEARALAAVAEKQSECDDKLSVAKDREEELLCEIEQKLSCIKELEDTITSLRESLLKTEARLALAEACAESSDGVESESTIETAELQELRRKAALYDELGASLGSSLTNATIAAHNLLVAARNEADSIRRQAETELEIAREAIRQSAVEAVDDICNIIGNATIDELDKMLESLDEARDSATELADSISRKSWESRATITYIKTTLEAEIGRRLSMIAYTPDSLLSSMRDADDGDAPHQSAPQTLTVSGETGESVERIVTSNVDSTESTEKSDVLPIDSITATTESKPTTKPRRASIPHKRRSIFSMLVSRPAKRSKKK